MSSDYTSPPKELFFVPIEEQYIYIKSGDYGLIILQKKENGSYDAHLALNTNSWGKAAWICREAIKWVFNNIDGMQEITASISSHNHKTNGLIHRLGFKQIDSNQVDYVMRDNIKYKINHYIFTKEMLCLF